MYLWYPLELETIGEPRAVSHRSPVTRTVKESPESSQANKADTTGQGQVALTIAVTLN